MYRYIPVDELNVILANNALWYSSGNEQGQRADLSGANLSGANLRGANLSGADLRRANLSEANLSEADLDPIRDAIYSVLARFPNEAEGILATIEAGCINGSMYDGTCVCLIGTIANLRGCNYDELSPDSFSLEESWFLAIRPGDTPANSQLAAITTDWIKEWVQKQAEATI